MINKTIFVLSLICAIGITYYFVMIKSFLRYQHYRYLFFCFSTVVFGIIVYSVVINKIFFISSILIVLLWLISLERYYKTIEATDIDFSKNVDQLQQEKKKLVTTVDEQNIQFTKLSDQLAKLKKLFLIVQEINENIQLEKIVKEFFNMLNQHFQNKIQYLCLATVHKKEIVAFIEYPQPREDVIEKYKNKLTENVNHTKLHNILEYTLYSNNYNYVLIIEHNAENESEIISDLNFFITETKIGFVRAILFHEVEQLSRHDGLTGLYLRRYFVQRLNNEYLRALRYNSVFSLLMIDIDFFKKINDTYGHLAGDYVLKNLAQIINSFIGSRGLCSRWGGEEFLVFIPYQDKIKTKLLAEELRKKVEEEKFVYEQQEIKLTVSCGVSSFPEDGDDITKLFTIADERLYKAKQSGRNKVVDS